MKRILVYLGLTIFVPALVLFSCQKENSTDVSAKTEQSLLKENVAILDLRVRTIDNDTYIKEVVILNFSSEPLNKQLLVLKGKNYSDDGMNNDLTAGDGVFASFEQYRFDNIVKFDKNKMIRSLSGHPIIDPTFRKSNELRSAMDQYAYYDNSLGTKKSKTAIVEVTCPIKFGTNGCIAERIGICRNCCFSIDFNNCTVTIGF
jgi:hypothetical protein